MSTRAAQGRTPACHTSAVTTGSTCCSCGKTKAVSEFGLDRSRISGINSVCRQCSRDGQARRSVHGVSVSEKRCATCGETKPASQFWRRPLLKDGLMSSCKACKRKRQAVSFGEWQKSELERHPEKVRARRLVKAALGSGKLVKRTHCEACGKELPLHAHHSDYDRPLEVAWLCHSCHIKLHVRLHRGVRP